jgi:hypothetical protein
MKRVIFIFAVALLTLFCNIVVKSQEIVIYDSEEWTQKELSKKVDWVYDNFKDFDRECFLIGALNDINGHYQTFTANKSSDEIDDKVKWLYRKDLKFIPDTMRCQRITTFPDWRDESLALFITALFKNDYPDLRALRVYSISPFVRYYGGEIKSYENKDPVCNYATKYEVELFSSSLAKTVAGYYNFDYDNVSAISSGGDIGYSGVINREKISTEAQKMSFLAGVFIRHDGWDKSLDESNRSSIKKIHNSLSTTKMCIDILREFGCENVEDQTRFKEEFIVFNASDKIKDLISLLYDMYTGMSIGGVIY